MTTHTRSHHTSIAAIATGVLLLAAFGLGCNEDPPASLFDPNYVSGSTPVISAITPTSGLGGVTVMNVTGLNFSTVPAYNQVVFRPASDIEGALLGTVVQASATSLQVRAPILAGDTIEVRVAVRGAELYSDPAFCSLSPAQREWGAFSQSDAPAGIACDVAGNVYFSNLYTGSADSVYTISPDNVQTPYSPAFSSQVPRWTGMKVGPGGTIYCVGGRNIIFEIPAGGGTVALWQRGGVGNVLDLDFDQPGNVWTAGTGTAVYSVTPAKTVTSFTIEQTSVRTVRVFGGYLYYGGTRGSNEGVWRRQILAADNLGAEEVYFDYSAVYTEGAVNAITFAADGDMYVGTDGPEGIVVVHAGGASEAFYPGIVEPANVAFAWGAGTELFVSRSGGTAKATVVRLEMQKEGAPTYGRLLP